MARITGGRRLGLWAVALLLPIFLSSGCYLMPNWGSPGTIGQQRNRAVLYDPYPRNDLGPKIESGRPLGFETPLAEPSSNQIMPRRQRGAPVQPYSGF